MNISDFEIVEKLGTQKHRKFNGVYLVTNRLNGEKGVCKKLEKTAKNEHLVPLLRQEAAISFSEKGLPKTLFFEETETEITLIRNFQEGIPLDAYWKGIPKKAKVSFVSEMIEKLIPLFEVLKTAGIVHCDIKPSNIIIKKSDGELEVSLIDFGISLRKNQEIPERKTLFALGYSAPELILNQLELVNHTTDLFSLGISIWQLFTGKLPLMHANPGIMTNLQITHPLPKNNAIPKTIWPVIEKMCLKHAFRLPPNKMKDEEVKSCLQHAMNNRFQNLKEILDALKTTNSRKSWISSWFFRAEKR